jgi:hypothetical protein
MKRILLFLLFSASAFAQSVTVSFLVNTTAGPVTSFIVLRATTTAGPFVSVGTVPYVPGMTSYSFKDTTVVNGTSYYYIYEQVGNGGTSGASPISAVATIPFQVPATPTTAPTVLVGP